MSRFLITFCRDSLTKDCYGSADLGEKIGKWTIGWLSLGFGQKVKATRVLDEDWQTHFEEKAPPTWLRVVAIISAVVLFPVSLVLGGIGCIGLAYSESHHTMASLYLNSLKHNKKPPYYECRLPVDDIVGRENIVRNLNRGIPPNCDIRGTKWLSNTHHIYPYAKDLLSRVNPNALCIPVAGVEDAKSYLNHFLPMGDPFPEVIAFCPIVPPQNNQWSLVYVCTRTRMIEYYNSNHNYGNHDQMMRELDSLALILNEKDPGENPYQPISKIRITLQADGFQGGPWALYFLKMRAQNPDVDFNLLDDAHERQMMIANFRLEVMERLIALHNERERLMELEVDQPI